MDYNVTGDFTRAPLGPFTNANKKLVWSGLSDDADPNGKYFEIVSDSRFPGGRACRMKYPKGSYGMKDQFYQIRIKSPQTTANLEFMMLFESNFSFMTPNSHQNCGGKIGPCINWGEVGGDNAKRGTRAMMWWNGHGSNYPNPKFSPSCQDQATGNQLIQPVKYSSVIVTNQIYKFRIQIKGGPGGRAKYWITYPGQTTETLLADTGTKDMKATATDDVLFDFAFFSGGASNDYCPEWDSFARHGGIHYWSGESNTGNGDTGNGGGNGSTPVPPDGETTSPYSIAVGETKIFRANFPGGAQGDVKWKLDPNNVNWGVQAGPNWSAIQVTGKTVGTSTLTATDPVTGKSTDPVKVDITSEPRVSDGFCTVEPLPSK